MQLKSIVRCAQALAIAIGASAVMSPLAPTPASAAAVTYDFLIFEITYTVCREVREGVEVCQNLTM